MRQKPMLNHVCLIYQMGRKMVLKIFIIFTLFFIIFATGLSYAQKTKWTKVYDGKIEYTFYADASSSSLPESPLDQATYATLISQLTVSPTISDPEYALELLQIAANKVVFSNIDYDSAFPYSDDLFGHYIDGLRPPTTNTSITDDQNNTVSLYMVGDQGNWLQWTSITSGSGGLKDYESRKMLYKKLLVYLIFDLEQQKVEEFYSAHENFFHVLDLALAAGKPTDHIINLFKKYKVLTGNVSKEVISRYVSTALSIAQTFDNVTKDKKMIALIAAAAGLESYSRVQALYNMSYAALDQSIDFDPALFEAVYEIYVSFQKYYSGDEENQDDLFKKFVFQMVSNAQGTSDFRYEYIHSAAETLVLTIGCMYTPVFCAIIFWEGQLTLEALDYQRSSILSSTIYRTIEDYLKTRPVFVSWNDVENIKAYMLMEQMRVKSALMAIEAINCLLEMPGSGLSISDEDKNFYLKYEEYLENVLAVRRDPWCLAGEQTAEYTGSADMRWLESIYVPNCTSIASPTNIQATAVSINQINITWSYPDNNVDRFEIHRRAGENGTENVFTVLPTDRSFQDTNGLSPGTTYYYYVCAVVNQEIACSDEVEVTTQQSQAGITAYADPNPVNVNLATTIHVTVTDDYGNPVPAGTSVNLSTSSNVFFQSSDSSGTGSITVTTDSEGKAWAYMSSPAAGTVNVTITSNGKTQILPIMVQDPYQGGEWTAEWNWILETSSETESKFYCSVLVKHNGELLPLNFDAYFYVNHGSFTKSKDEIGSTSHTFENYYTLTKAEADSGDEVITIKLYQAGTYITTLTYVGNFYVGPIQTLSPYVSTAFQNTSDRYATGSDVSSDGLLIASVEGMYIKVRQMGTWKTVRSSFLQEDGNCVSFSPDNSQVVVGDEKGYIYRISVSDGSKISKRIAKSDVLDIDWYAPNRIVIVTDNYKSSTNGNEYSKVVLCDQNLNIIWSTTLPDTPLGDYYIRVAGNAERGLIAVSKKGIDEYDRWYLLRESDHYVLKNVQSDNHILALAFSSDGRLFYAGGYEGHNFNNYLYKVSYSGGSSISLTSSSLGNPQTSIRDIESACFFDDGSPKLALIGDKKLEIFQASGGRILRNATTDISYSNAVVGYAPGKKVLWLSIDNSQKYFNLSGDLMSPGVSIVPPMPIPFEVDQIILTGTVSDASGTVTMQYQVGGGSWTFVSVDSSGNFTIPLNNLALGDTLVKIKACDYYYNTSEQTISVTRLPDMSAPVVSPGTVNPEHGGRGTAFNISVNIQDATGVSSAVANVRNQYGSVVASLPMSTNDNSNYTVTFVSDDMSFGGMYSVDVTVIDSSPAANIATYKNLCNFTIDAYTLTVYSNGNGGTVEPSGVKICDVGETVTLNATPKENFTFSGWSGDFVSNMNPVTINMTKDMFIMANFQSSSTCTLILDVVEGNGSVVQSGNGTYNYGETVTITATPDPGWAFSYWSGDVTGSNNPITITMDGNKRIHAHFIKETKAPNDFNGDGKSDILWRNSAIGRNSIWFMDGGTLIGSQYLITVSDSNWEIKGTGDFNGDGKSDILWRNSATGRNSIWFMDGGTLIGSQYLITVSDSNWEIR